MKRGWFTLIELLVVIAVMFVLCALPLPALNKARDKAKSVDCMSNMKHVGTAMNQYCKDNLDYMLTRSIPKLTPEGKIKSECRNMESWWDAHLLIHYFGKSKTFKRDGKDNSVFLCPDSSSVFKKIYGGSFRLNQVTGAYWLWASRLPKLTEFPGSCMWFGEENAGIRSMGGYFQYELSRDPHKPGNYAALPKHHHLGGNYYFVDGHCQWESYANVTRGTYGKRHKMWMSKK